MEKKISLPAVLNDKKSREAVMTEIKSNADTYKVFKEEAVQMFSEALRIMDENTVKYMIEEQAREIEEQSREIEEQKNKIKEQENKIKELKEIVERKKIGFVK